MKQLKYDNCTINIADGATVDILPDVKVGVQAIRMSSVKAAKATLDSHRKDRDGKVIVITGGNNIVI